MPIQVFEDINASHAATGFHGRTDLPSFHIFTIEDTYPSTSPMMAPYRFGFYQVVFLENSADAALTMNTEAIADLTDSLTFASPQHVLAWMRGAAQRGYIVYFKDELVARYLDSVVAEFPFFGLTESNLLRAAAFDKPILQGHFERLMSLFAGRHPYRLQLLALGVLSLLYECKRLYDAQEQTLAQAPPRAVLATRFQRLVEQQFLTCRTVEAYAELMAVSPDYLGRAVKTVTGKPAHRLIDERILLEAKKLLAYSSLTAAEIADYLGYAEPTHFGRFFRRAVGISPALWRQQHTEGN